MEKTDWSYTAIVFDSLADLEREAEDNIDLFPQLLNCHLVIDQDMINFIKKHFEGIYGKGILSNSQIRLFPNFDEFAAYEVYDGWYVNFLDNISKEDFRGAPNLYYFLDYHNLGRALEESMDKSIYLKLNNEGAVLQVLDI